MRLARPIYLECDVCKAPADAPCVNAKTKKPMKHRHKSRRIGFRDNALNKTVAKIEKFEDDEFWEWVRTHVFMIDNGYSGEW